MKVKLCPNCGSLDIHLFLGGDTGIQYKCETCGYQGPMIIERDVGKNFRKSGK